MQGKEILGLIIFVLIMLTLIAGLIVSLCYDSAQIQKKNEYKTNLNEHDLKVITDYIAKSKLTFKEFMKRKKQK